MSNPSDKIIIIAAPSGAGKTSIVRFLLARFEHQLGFSISCATRKPRINEKDGVDYYFINAENFQQKISEDQFAEWEMVYEGKYYGTLRSELNRIWSDKKVPLLDIDVKGGLRVKENYPQSLCLFIQPPSLEELKKRLEARGTETAASLATRLDKASLEMRFSIQFDNIIINDQLDKACEEVARLVAAYIA
ncbi:MAG: guanylate kinase [Bacteroidota bacterium]|nr:guanylate kinase [Bacteroidota bacterium]